MSEFLEDAKKEQAISNELRQQGLCPKCKNKINQEEIKDKEKYNTTGYCQVCIEKYLLVNTPKKKENPDDLKRALDFEIANDANIRFERAIVRKDARQFMWRANTLKEMELSWTSLKTKYGLAKSWKEIYNEFIEKKDKEILDKINSKKKSLAIMVDKMLQAEEMYKERPFFYDKTGSFWFWDTTRKCYERVDETELLNEIYMAGNNTIKNHEKTEVINALKQYGRMRIPKPAPKSWINFKNGIVDIKEHNYERLKEATPNYFITHQIPHNFGKAEDINLSDEELIERSYDTPIIDELFSSWVKPSEVTMMLEIIAYCLYTDYPIHRLFCFCGSGLNGKSTYLNLIKNYIGEDNCTSVELDEMIENRFTVTKLHKKLVCTMGETNFAEISKTSKLKKLTGQDMVGFEYKNKTPFDDVNYAKIIIATNNLPPTTDKTIGFYRRWLIIDFNNTFTEEEDVLLRIKEEEYERLGLRLVSILRDLLKVRAFTNEGTIEDRMKKFEEHSNYFEKFFTEFIDEEPDGNISKKIFREKFTDWCKENRHRIMSDVTISKNMKDRGIETKQFVMYWVDKQFNSQGYETDKPKYWGWVGIKWKQ